MWCRAALSTCVFRVWTHSTALCCRLLLFSVPGRRGGSEVKSTTALPSVPRTHTCSESWCPLLASTHTCRQNAVCCQSFLKTKPFPLTGEGTFLSPAPAGRMCHKAGGRPLCSLPAEPGRPPGPPEAICSACTPIPVPAGPAHAQPGSLPSLPRPRPCGRPHARRRAQCSGSRHPPEFRPHL